MFSNLLPEEDSKAEPTRLNASFFILTRYHVEKVEVGAQNAGTNSSSKVFSVQESKQKNTSSRLVLY